MLEPTRESIAAFSVGGLKTRTTNTAEMNPATAQLGRLWSQFFSQDVMGKTPGRTADPRNFGVYAQYESDASGAFDVTAGVSVTQGATVEVEAGDYLVFKAEGAVPMSVVAAWQRVWQYFEEHPGTVRRYRTDFEAYSSPTEAAVYIGIERN